MDTGSAVGWLFGTTIAVVLVVLLFILYRARRSQAKRGEAPGEVKVGECRPLASTCQPR
jgi:hypothetical protein